MEMTLEEALKKAIELHQQGHTNAASKYYAEILKVQPTHPDANHNLGVLYVVSGNAQQALPFLQKALEVNPNIEQFWLSYVTALCQLSRVEEAVRAFEHAKKNISSFETFQQIEKLIKGRPNEPENREPSVDQIQSIIDLYNKSQFTTANEKADILLNQFPESATLLNIKGVILQGLGQLEKAVETFHKLLSIKPDYAEAYSNMGNALAAKGNLDDALEAYKHAISLKPNFAEAWFNAGNIGRLKGNLDQALTFYQNALNHNSRYIEAFNNIGIVLNKQGKLKEAVKNFQNAIKIQPKFGLAYFNLGNAYHEHGHLDEAIAAYQSAISIQPKNAEAFLHLGNAFQDNGKINEAIQAYRDAIAIRSDYGEAFRYLSLLVGRTPGKRLIYQISCLIKKNNLSPDDISSLQFALAVLHEKCGDTSAYHKHLELGNAIRKQVLNYSIVSDKKLFLKLRTTQPIFQRNQLKIHKKPGVFEPIFIVGMPRSGTTLIEQILSSHSLVVGAGELRFVSLYGHTLSINPTSINKDTIAAFRNSYLSSVSTFCDENKMLTDKMPHNFRYVPLIRAAFPEAKIIHVRRTPEATCWSNYKHYFPGKGLGYCYDLHDTVEYYLMYRRLMTLWQKQYNEAIYDITYEALTLNPEAETRRLLSFIGLKFEKGCLSPHKNKRSVRTTSQQQVRSPIYKGSSEVWKEHKPLIKDAFLPLKIT